MPLIITGTQDGGTECTTEPTTAAVAATATTPATGCQWSSTSTSTSTWRLTLTFWLTLTLWLTFWLTFTLWLTLRLTFVRVVLLIWRPSATSGSARLTPAAARDSATGAETLRIRLRIVCLLSFLACGGRKLDPLRILGRREPEHRVVELGEVPFERSDKLRLRRLPKRGDDDLPRQRRLAALDPQLPVDVLLAIGVVITVGARDPGGPDVGRRLEVLQPRLVGAPEEEVGEGQLDAVLLLDRLRHLGNGARRRHRRVILVARPIERRRLAIVEELALLAVGVDVRAQPVGGTHPILHRAAELDLLTRVEHLVLGGVGAHGERLQRAQVGTHRLERLDRLGLDFGRRHRLGLGERSPRSEDRRQNQRQRRRIH